MIVTSIKLNQFRNYEALALQPHERLTALVGQNAQGKTNIVEAVYLLATGRSHRTSRDGELIQWGKEGAYLRIDVRRSIEHRLEMRIVRGGRKQIKKDGAPLRRMGELMGCLNVVMFSPEDLRLVKDGPGERRRFMDVLLCQIRPAYFYALSNYQRALSQRNALLKEVGFKKQGEEVLEVWEEQLARSGALICLHRAQLMELLLPLAQEMHGRVSGGREELSVQYEPNVSASTLEDCVEALLEALRRERPDDLRRGLTGKGPHRDDISLRLNGCDLRAFGSQGQQRTAALALKLAELQAMERDTGHSPVLLLDDVMSELDETRQSLLLRSIEKYQTILTCTQLPEGAFGAIYEVTEGSVKKKEHP